MTNNCKLPYLIVEIANSHAGSKKFVEELIKSFSKLNYLKKGIKFQIFEPETLALPDFKWYPVYKELFFKKNIWSTFIMEAAKHGDVWLDIFDKYAVEVLSENLNRVFGIKLQASVLENHEVFASLSHLNLKKKKIILNISGYELNLVKKIVDQFSILSKNIIIQFGYQRYPTKIKDTGLNKIEVLKSAFPRNPICIADHSDAEKLFSNFVPIYAILLGCSFIEKHFCLDRKNAKYDGFSSLDFKELSSLILNIKDACNASSGSFIKNAEIQYLKESIQIPTLNHDMIEGDLLSDTDLVYRRTSQYGIRIKEIFDLQKKKRVLKKIKSKYSSVVATDYRKAKIAIIVAGRMKSKRLLQKATLSLYGISSIERCLIQCLAIKNVDQVILATSNLNEDYILKNYTLNDTVSFVQGDPEDVINRYLFACDIHKVDIVVRITADCPLIIPEIIEHLIEQHFNSGADYTAAKDFAVGTSGEIINTNALKKVIKYFGRAKHSEYMTWYFKNNPKYFKINMVDLPPNLVRNYRMTLDYPEDLQMFEKLFEILGGGNRAYSAKEVFNSLDANPNIYNTNINLTLRYRTDQILINLLNKDTKISEKKRP